MRQEIENPIVKEPAAQLTIPYQDIIAEHQKMPPSFNKYLTMWKETERREKQA